MKISGESKLLAIIGDPISQAKTPSMANDRLLELDCFGEFVLMPMHVFASDLVTCINGLRQINNFAGAVVTMPHKSKMVDLLDDITPEAELVGAVNVISRQSDGRLKGTILDGEGFVSGLLKAGYIVSGTYCVLAGAGGAASAIAFALLQHGCDGLYIQNRTQKKADELVRRLKKSFPAKTIEAYVPKDVVLDIAINATKLGMRTGDDLPFPESIINRSHLIAECVLAPDVTKLLEKASKLGKRVHKGNHMLQAQIDLMLSFMGVSSK
jgi:shikimate dehydrogenase